MAFPAPRPAIGSGWGGRRSMASIPKEYPAEAVFFPALENRMRCWPAVKAWVPNSRVPDGETPPLGRRLLIDTPSVCTISSCQADCRPGSVGRPAVVANNWNERGERRILLKDRQVIRGLAAKWSELAALPVMTERKRLWKAVHDLQAERPVILFETAWIEGFVADGRDTLRGPVPAERREEHARHAPAGRGAGRRPGRRALLPARLEDAVFRLRRAGEIHPPMGKEKSIAYTFSFPIATPDGHRQAPAADASPSIARRRSA